MRHTVLRRVLTAPFAAPCQQTLGCMTSTGSASTLASALQYTSYTSLLCREGRSRIRHCRMRFAPRIVLLIAAMQPPRLVLHAVCCLNPAAQRKSACKVSPVCVHSKFDPEPEVGFGHEELATQRCMTSTPPLGIPLFYLVRGFFVRLTEDY